jgi:hypothetical protein
MDTKWTGRTRLTLLVVSVLATCVVPPQLRAQPDVSGTAAGEPSAETVSIDFERDSFGMARGQTARFTVINPAARTDQQGCGEFGTACARVTVSVVVTMMDQQGNLVAQSAETEIPPGEFRSMDFNRDAFLLPGEPGTGRLQIRPVLRMAFARSAPQGFDERLMASIEIVDNLTGRTTVLIPALLLPAIQKVRVAK